MATSVADWRFERGAEHTEFNRFLNSLWPGDEAMKVFVQEVVGYALSGHRDLQKIPVLIGPTRCGKSLFLNLLSAALGPDLAVTLGTAAIGENFGLQGTIGRRLAAVADMRLRRQVDHGALAERLLTFSGEDSVSIPRKNRTDWQGIPSAKLIFAGNEMPQIGDDSGAIAARMLPVVFERSFLGREDARLFGKLQAEIPAIVEWAAVGLARLRRRGRFQVPPASAALVASVRSDASPVAAFVESCCEVGQAQEIGKGRLFEVWNDWATENHERTIDRRCFGRSLRGAVPGLREAKRGPSGRQIEHYVGIGLKSPMERLISPDSSVRDGVW